MRILIVDDNEDLADNVAELLDDVGYEVQVAYSASGALSLLVAEQCFDYALLDVRMDGMDGVSLWEKIQARCPNTHGLLMTAFSSAQRLQQARDLGVKRILSKPFQPAELLAALPEVA